MSVEKQPPEMFYIKKLVLKISPYLQEDFIKNRLQHRCFPVNIAIFKNTYLEEYLQAPVLRVSRSDYLFCVI